MADQRVKEVQQWLNDRFPSYFKYDEENHYYGSYPIEPDGKTGTKTVKALIMAIQIHYNLTPVDGVWGTKTSNACPIINQNVTDSTIMYIVQGAFYCKGYEPGGFDGVWGEGVQAAIGRFQNDLGITETGVMNQNLFKSLLTTDPTVLTANGSAAIRKVQQYLNSKYYSLYSAKLGYIPTGGSYERKTSTALIYAFQSLINTTADGLLGTNTFSKMPAIGVGCTDTEIVKILQACLICNDFETAFNGTYDDALKTTVSRFQIFMHLLGDPDVIMGSVNRRTWGALLWSKGDINRVPNACDCATKILDPVIAEELYSRGFRYIGRYLTNTEVANARDKKLTSKEVNILLNAGLKIFPIFQETATVAAPADFTESRGRLDAAKAIKAAVLLEFKEDTVIYFAIDCDMMETDITNYAIPYFKGIKFTMEQYGGYYRIGVYGSRNTCSKVSAFLSGAPGFVSNMSTGYSGNLGYTMPKDWAFEQYREVSKYPIANTAFDLDFDMASGVDSGVNTEKIIAYVPPFNPETAEEPIVTTPILDLIDAIRWLEERYYSYVGCSEPTEVQITDCRKAVCDYLCQYMYEEYKWEIISPKDSVFIDYIKTHYPEDEHVKALHPYIYYYEEGKGNSKIVHRTKLVSDGRLGIFELPHFAIVIKCYIASLVSGHWSAWAGDFATGIKDVYVNMALTGSYLSTAKLLIGAMEPDDADISQTRMFNYCDFIADLDGYAIYQMLENSKKVYGLSESIRMYFGDSEKYDKRYKYFKDILEFEAWDIDSIYNSIYDYYTDQANSTVFMLFCEEAGTHRGSAEATSMVLALNIMYWAKYTNVI